MSSDVHLGCAALIHTRAQPIPDHLFEPADRRFGSGSLRAAGRLLPRHAPVLGDVLEMAVALRGRGLGRCSEHGCCPRGGTMIATSRWRSATVTETQPWSSNGPTSAPGGADNGEDNDELNSDEACLLLFGGRLLAVPCRSSPERP